MKRIKISNNVIRRLPKYLRKLDELSGAGVERISSGELGRQMGLTPSQIRQDFSCFGEFGQQGYGYNIASLRQEISRILGMDRGYSCVLVGVGHIGKALIGHFNFESFGFTLTDAFDVKSDVVDTSICGVPVHDMNELADRLSAQHTDVAILCVPSYRAKEVAQTLVSCGVRGIWNFTNVELDVPADTITLENIYFSDSLLSLGYYLSEHLDEQAARAARQRK